MTDAPAGGETLDQVIARTRYLLLDFDGPICGIFAGHSDLTVADRLRELLAAGHVELPDEIKATSDPLAVFTYSATISAGLAARVQADMTEQELAAVPTARPTAYARDVITSCTETGRTVAVVSNNSELAVRAYLERNGLHDRVAVISARTSPDPELLKPSPHLITQAIRDLHGSPADCVLIGDSVSDVQAGHAAAISVIGYANKPGKHERLTAAGAAAVITSLADLVLPLRARPLPN